jgi:hypothetical protein
VAFVTANPGVRSSRGDGHNQDGLSGRQPHVPTGQSFAAVIMTDRTMIDT